MSEKRKRDVVWPIRLLPEEAETIKSYAAQCRMPAIRYLRERGLKKRPRAIVTVNEQAAYQLVKLANNVNQLAHLARIERLTPLESDLRALLSRIDDKLDALLR
jgi:hypothetical protein